MSIYSQVRQALRLGTIAVLSEYFPDTTTQNKGILFSHTNGTEPSTPYVVIQIVKVVQEGRSSYSTSANTLEQLTLVSNYKITAQFSFIGTLAGDMAYDFNNSIINNVVMREAFQRLNIVPVEKSVLRRVPAIDRKSVV